MTIKNTTLGTAATTIYTSSGETALTTMYFCNTSPGELTFNIYAVPAGDTAGPSNIIYYALQIAPTDTFVLDAERLILEDGDSIVANATISGSIVSTVSSVSV